MTQNSSASRVTEVWRRLAGMYGADTLARKFGNAIPEEWTAMLGQLNEFQVRRGIRMLAYSGKAHVPSLPEFVKLCRDAEPEREISDQACLPAPDDWTGDKWDLIANRLLLQHIRDRCAIDSRAFGVPESKQQADATAILVSYKKAWSQGMRVWDIDCNTGEVIEPSKAEMQETWKDFMQRAHAEIDGLLKAAA